MALVRSIDVAGLWAIVMRHVNLTSAKYVLVLRTFLTSGDRRLPTHSFRPKPRVRNFKPGVSTWQPQLHRHSGRHP
jgi:hypothetical protein